MDLLRTDGSWSIVVCVAAFVSHTIIRHTFMLQFIVGSIQTSGIYYAYIQSTYDVSSVATSWLCSMSFVGAFLGASIGGPIIKRFGCRLCSFCGALLSSFGFAMCMVATNYYLLFLFFGICGCVGNGIQISGHFAAVNAYFDRYISSAQNLASVGIGVGVSVCAVLFTELIEMYGWKGALLIQAGVSLNGCVLACLLIPRPTKTTARKTIRYSLILKPHILLTCLHFYLVEVPESVVYVHLPMLMTSRGFSSEAASLGLLILGISNMVSRVVYAIPCRVGAIKLYTINVIASGLLMLAVSFFTTLSTVLMCLGAIGFTFIIYGGLNLLVLRNIVEQDEFVDVAALVFTFKTVSAISSGPIAGLVFDWTHDYKYEFWLSSFLALTSCLFLIPNMVRKGQRANIKQELDELVRPVT